MPIARYELNNCQGSHVSDFIEIEVPENFNKESHEVDALRAAGYDPDEICESCNDHSYRAKFIELV